MELALAKRYYIKTFNEGVAPANDAGLGGALCTYALSSDSAAYFQIPNGMYAGIGSNPTVTTYNPSDTNSDWRDITKAVDIPATIDPAGAKGGTGVQVATQQSGTFAYPGDQLCIHVVYDSHFR